MGVFLDPRLPRTIAALVTGLLLVACGGSASDGVSRGPVRTYQVAVHASFPSRQRLAQHSRLVITVRNTGTHPMPNVAVTLSNPRDGTAAQALGTLIPKPKQGKPLLASRSRPIWIIDRPPGPCTYSCDDGGPGGAITAYTNTWSLGRVKPGQTRRFIWHVTAIRAGTHRIDYSVAAGLSGRLRAVRNGGATAAGVLHIQVTGKPPSVRVSQSGTVHYG
jgi:hypothetical protein